MQKLPDLDRVPYFITEHFIQLHVSKIKRLVIHHAFGATYYFIISDTGPGNIRMDVDFAVIWLCFVCRHASVRDVERFDRR